MLAYELERMSSADDEAESYPSAIRLDDLSFSSFANAAIDAFLGALSETHAVVPREPTEEMVDAGVLAASSRDRWDDNARNIYCAMVNSISSKS